MNGAKPPLLKCLIMWGVGTGIDLPNLFYVGKSLMSFVNVPFSL